jgi:hypothetical protein
VLAAQRVLTGHGLLVAAFPTRGGSSRQALPLLPSQPCPQSSWPSTSHGSMSSALLEVVAAPHSLLLLGEGVVTVPPVPPGVHPVPSSNAVNGQLMSSTLIVQWWAELHRPQRQPQPVGVFDSPAGDGVGGPTMPLGSGASVQNALLTFTGTEGRQVPLNGGGVALDQPLAGGVGDVLLRVGDRDRPLRRRD